MLEAASKYLKQNVQFLAKFEYLDEIGDFVGEIARAGGFRSKDIYYIQLAADEAASNIIEHAYEGVKNGVLEILCGVKDGANTRLGHPERDFPGSLAKARDLTD